ncbi:MAG TPA: DUF3455 domain-containing protein, partial [Gemmataceae bacterium]|nr:DUF3455 domain-containing protein [Gemmataceae bacterium]
MAVVIRRGVVKLAASALLLLAAVAHVGADTGYDNRLPDLGECQQLRVEAGNIVAFQAEAVGVQIYRWNGTKWDFVGPEAVLFHGRAVVAIHYAGPTWESASGSKVVGAVVDRGTPDPDSVPWLLLKATSTEGPGIFA